MCRISLWLIVCFLILTSFTPKSEIPPIVFVSRNQNTANIIPGIAPSGRALKLGGKLFIRESSGKIRQLARGLYDVADVGVSYDASKIVFSGLAHPDSSWRIYEIGVNGKELHQITWSNLTIDLSQFGSLSKVFSQYDDFDPCYLPDGRIIFASTRYPSLAPFNKIRTSNLFAIDPDGKNLRRLTTEKNGAEEPTIDNATGKIVFSRWWLNIDLPSNRTKEGITRNVHDALTDDIGNVWHAITAKPDGDELKLYAGFPRTRQGLQAYKPFIMDNGDLLCTFTSVTSMLKESDTVCVRRFKKGASLPITLSEEKAIATDAIALSPNQILFAQKHRGKTFGLVMTDSIGSWHQSILDFPDTDELDPLPLVPRPIPPILTDNLELVNQQPPIDEPFEYYEQHGFRFDCFNIFMNGKIDEPMPDAPTITRDATVRFFMNIQRKNSNGEDIALLINEVAVDADGGIRVPLAPAEVPLFEQLVDSRGNLLRTSSGKIAHVSGLNSERKGAGTKCVGCHTGHTLIEVPMNNALSQWFNAATSATATASSEFSQNGVRFKAARAIDRQVELGADTSMWIADEKNKASLTLRWPMPIETREIVLYDVSKKKQVEQNIFVKKGRIELFYQSNLVCDTSFAEFNQQNNHRFSINHMIIDEMRITLESSFEYLLGLGEVEVIAKLAN